jgi:hypothetical protein
LPPSRDLWAARRWRRARRSRFTGPFAAGGSEAAAIGTQIAIDIVNEQGGVEGYKTTPVVADASPRRRLRSPRPSAS